MVLNLLAVLLHTEGTGTRNAAQHKQNLACSCLYLIVFVCLSLNMRMMVSCFNEFMIIYELLYQFEVPKGFSKWFDKTYFPHTWGPLLRMSTVRRLEPQTFFRTPVIGQCKDVDSCCLWLDVFLVKSADS